MSQTSQRTDGYIGRLQKKLNVSELADFRRQMNKDKPPLPGRVPKGNDLSQEGVECRRAFLRKEGCCPEMLCKDLPGIEPEQLKGAIENSIGCVSIPVGVIGPLRVTGLYANGDYFVPFATTEGALVASYHRGAHVVSRNGGVTSLCVSESISRAPAFTFDSIVDAGIFIAWSMKQLDTFKSLAAETTRHGKLVEISQTLNSNTAFLTFDYETADAAGQNMVTVATERVCRWIVANTPVKPVHWYVEGNFSGDKKATMLSFISHRGRKVVAEAEVAAADVKRFLHSTPEAMVEYYRVSNIGAIQSGSIGVHGHYANALAAIFLCTGQDVACLAEASVGITTMQVRPNGNLYVSVSLPNLTVGTVGGGTFLPGARDALRMLDCEGSGKACKFAEICAAAVLAGEVSIIAAMTVGDFAKAHTTFRHDAAQSRQADHE
ncbi:MAG: hydroxymethylglutaryl-CoA reductase [Kiritimatiellae bacterium]|nr:hydroxymethylglutaryl-CoA reductase [Kiritimatiellia bacterium]